LNRFDFHKIRCDYTGFNIFIVDSDKIRFDTCKIQWNLLEFSQTKQKEG